VRNNGEIRSEPSQRKLPPEEFQKTKERNLIARCVRLVPSIPVSWYAIPLRLIVGFGFIHHGYAKLARGPESFTHILSALGLFDPPLLAWATIIVEILGGLAVIAGLLIPLASIPMIIVLLVAIFTVHLPNGFSSIKLQSVTAAGAHFGQPGYETDLLYVAGILALVLGGSGPLALDRYLFGSRARADAGSDSQDLQNRKQK
jgi:putative oxidoreductase